MSDRFQFRVQILHVEVSTRLKAEIFNPPKLGTQQNVKIDDLKKNVCPSSIDQNHGVQMVSSPRVKFLKEFKFSLS